MPRPSDSDKKAGNQEKNPQTPHALTRALIRCLQNASEDVVVIVWSLVDGVANQDEDDDVGNLELV